MLKPIYKEVNVMQLEIEDMFKKTDSKHCKYCDTLFKIVDVNGRGFDIDDYKTMFKPAKLLLCPKCRRMFNIFWDNDGNPHPVYKKEFFECIIPSAHW